MLKTISVDTKFQNSEKYKKWKSLIKLMQNKTFITQTKLTFTQINIKNAPTKNSQLFGRPGHFD